MGEFLLPILTGEEVLALQVLIHETLRCLPGSPGDRGDLNAIILCWSEAQTNRQVKAEVSSFQLKYRASLTQIVVKW